ncbi:hypothetical protein K443DRAFT_88918 [Laccaria amethystina LaAM-08-1]|uniref:4-coumarate--CoA ligase n=1 Tax=Laccaria amethystina LaAM-08-1 TaxID=1095629 RepID=A0A0C9Y900_9AGAR|nr:hypothetical protein K443DRAFT_88918 [Laccaria amethystina LaAM-08-1]
MSWKPQRTLQEVNAILCAPGSPHELQTRLVDGKLQRVYKNLWPSLRMFWLSSVQQHKDATYVVFENLRYTFGQVFERALKAAAIYRNVYGVCKGDRVAICSRNYPEYLVAFWACHLIGAVSVLANAWSPLDTLVYCLTHTQCKLIIVDSERADRLEPITSKLAREAQTNSFLVIESHEGKGEWAGMKTWDAVFDAYKGDTQTILNEDFEILPEDNAAILFTSGTTGLPKGVLSTQRQYLTNVLNVLVGSRRAALRRGDDIIVPPRGPQKGILISVPLFHVTGSTSLSMLATLTGLKIVLMRKWDVEEANRLIQNEDIGIAGGVPSMVADLTGSSKVCRALASLMFGGSPAPDSLTMRAKQAFPTAVMSQGYGLTETNSVAVGFAGEDYDSRPASCGLPTPVNDIVIMNNDIAVPPGTVGEVWLRGPNIMKGYWRDQVILLQALTEDGWLKTGDLGMVDEEGFLYIRDRMKDIIIRGGENIDSVSVENTLYADDRVSEAAAVGVPDIRLGELVAAVVSIKPGNEEITEASLIKLAQKSLPRFAVPVIVVIQNEPFERTPSGKILKVKLRKVVRDAWEKRANNGPGPKL